MLDKRIWIPPRDASVCLCPEHAPFYQKASQVCVCPHCHRFFRYCVENETIRKFEPCHHYELIFTDGACRSNGRYHATSGIGIAIGETPDLQWSIPIDDSIDPYGKRTNQRAEVLAAIEGIKRMVAHRQEQDDHMDVDEETHQKKAWIIASDSEYLVSSMVEWFPGWKVCCMLFLPRFSTVHLGK